MCGHTFLYSPAVRRIKEILDAGELGDLHFISSSRTNLGPYRSDVSVLFDLGPHDFSMLVYWLGSTPERVSAMGRDVISEGVQDVAFVDLVFPDGMLAHAEMSWLAPSKLRRTVIVGSEKMLVYEDGTPEPLRIFDSGIEIGDTSNYGQYQLSYRSGDIVSLRVPAVEPITAELVDFRDAIATGEEPISDERMALDVIAIVEAAEASLAAGGAVTPVVSARSGAERVVSAPAHPDAPADRRRPPHRSRRRGRDPRQARSPTRASSAPAAAAAIRSRGACSRSATPARSSSPSPSPASSPSSATSPGSSSSGAC